MDPHQPPGPIHPQQPLQMDPQQAPDPQVDPQQGQQMHPQQPPPMHPQQPQVHPQQAPYPQVNPQQAPLIPHQMYLQQPPQMDPQQAPDPQVDPQQPQQMHPQPAPHPQMNPQQAPQMDPQQPPQVHPQQAPHPQVDPQQAQQMYHQQAALIPHQMYLQQDPQVQPQQAPQPQMDPQQAPLMHPHQMYLQQPPQMDPQQPHVHPQQAPHPQVDPQQPQLMYPHQMYLQQPPQMDPQQMYPQQAVYPQVDPQLAQQMHPQQMYPQQPHQMPPQQAPHQQMDPQQVQQMHPQQMYPQQPHQMPPPQAPHQQMDPQQAQLMDLQQAQQRYHLQLHPLVYPSPFPQINFQNIPQMRPRQARLRLPPHPLLIPHAQELNLPPDSPPKQRLLVREARVYNLPEDKYIQLIVHMEPNITKPVIKVPRFRFYFLDTLLSDIKDILQISQYAPYDYFEYEEDGDLYSVRTDTEVKELVNSLMPQPLHIHLRSNRMNAPLRVTDLALPLSDITRERVIASGHFGEVSRGYDRANNRVIAVKKIKNFLGDAEKLLLCDEVNILRMARRCHYVVYFYNALYNNSELMLVFEFMNGLSLDKYGVLPVHVHAAVSICVVEGLTFLWKNNVMHRDIKPSNILVNTKGEVKITDFGTSRIIKDRAVVYSEVGTQAYLSPEQTSGNPYSLPSEVWSLGITLAEMAIGTTALFPEPHSQVCNVPRHVEQNLPNINERLAAYDVGLHILVIWCLLMNPAWRLDWRDVIHRAYIVCNRPIRHDFIARYVRGRLPEILDRLKISYTDVL